MTSLLLSPQQLPGTQVFGEPHLYTDGEIQALAFAADGALWTMEDPGVLRHWSLPGPKLLEYSNLSDLESLWCFSPDARVLACASDDLTLWDTSSGLVLTSLPQASWVTALTFAPDATHLATGHDDGLIRFWDLSDHHLAFEWRRHQRPISALAISRDGKILAAAAEDKTISLWSLVDGKELGTLVGHTDRIPALAWHPDSKHLVSAGWDTTARVWDVRRREPIMLYNSHDTQVTALAFSPQGRLLASADSSLNVHIWDFATHKDLRILTGPQGEVHHLTFSADGLRLAASGDRSVHVWEADTGKAIAGAGPRPEAHTSLTLSPSGKELATNGGGAAACIYAVADGRLLRQLETVDPLHGLAYFPDGQTIVGAATRTMRLWDAATGAVKTDLVGSEEEPATCVAVSPDGALFACGSSYGLDVWIFQASGGEPILAIPDALVGCKVEALAFHPQGRVLAVGGIDVMATGGSPGAVCLWDLIDRCEIATLGEGCTSLAYHPSGAHLAVATPDHSILILNATRLGVIRDLVGHEDAVFALAYSPDGQWLASAGEDRTLRLWDEHGQEHAALEVDSTIHSLTFSPDGQHLFTANANTTCTKYRLAEVLGK